jgi:hypothetical protein
MQAAQRLKPGGLVGGGQRVTHGRDFTPRSGGR